MTWKSLRYHLYTIARWAFFIASIAFLVSFVHKTMLTSGQPLWPLIREAAGETLVSAVLFALAALTIVPAWRSLLRSLGVEQMPVGVTLRIFCLTQIAKYVPGNIGHHIGRVALARSTLGIPAATTVISIFQESTLVVATAVLVGGASYGVSLPASTPGATRLASALGADVGMLFIAALIAGFGTLALADRYRARLAGPGAPAWRSFVLRATPTSCAVLGAFPAYVFVHILNGGAVACIASAMLPLHATDLMLLTGAYALSWVLGFLLPGAPGGLGVRESAFVLLAGPYYPPDIILAIATLSRIGAIVADVLVFLGGATLALRRGNSPHGP